MTNVHEVIEAKLTPEVRTMLQEIQAKVENRTLADAIREGARFTADCNAGGWVDADGNLCAMSAAALAQRARHG